MARKISKARANAIKHGYRSGFEHKVADQLTEAKIKYQYEKTVIDYIKPETNHTYTIDFTGNMIGFTNALWTNFELIEKVSEGENHTCKVKILNEKMTLNNLLQAVLPEVQVHGVSEIIPSMNDIFIQVVESQNAQINE